MIWTEKYRPQKFEDVVGISQEIPASLSNLPNLLFIGKPGTGKTTTAKIIIKELGCESLMLNASDERGIDVIRDKVKTFAMTSSHDGKIKVVFLDEADALTRDAQTSLRNTIELYHKNCRFILTGNYENKFIDAIVSRLTPFRFAVDDKNVLDYLYKIIKAENMNITDTPVVDEIIKRNKGDIRKCVNQLQKLSHIKGREITLEDIDKEALLPSIIHEALKEADFVKARQVLLDSNVEYDNFLDDYHEYILDLCLVKKQMTGTQFTTTINYLADAISKIGHVISKEIIVESFLLKMIGVLK